MDIQLPPNQGDLTLPDNHWPLTGIQLLPNQRDLTATWPDRYPAAAQPR